MSQPINNPVVFEDRFLAGIFVATLEWRRRIGHADAQPIHFRSAQETDRGIEVTFNRPLPEPLYNLTMRDVARWYSNLRRAAPRPAAEARPVAEMGRDVAEKPDSGGQIGIPG